MSSRRVQIWVWWLLPFLVARALMPVGFMAQAHEGKFQIVFCAAGVSLPQAAAHDDAGSDHASQSDFSCPFAHAAAAPLLDSSSSAVITFFPSAEMFPPADLPNHASGPPRFDLARGPPALS